MEDDTPKNNHSTGAEELAPLSEEDRRDFLRRATRYAVAAPATALLLQTASKQAKAYPTGPTGPTGATGPTGSV